MAIEVPASISSSNGRSLGNELHGLHAPPPDAKKIATVESVPRSYPPINSKFLPIVGLFVFYILHDALQERMFRYHGFSYGFFMTLVEVVVMLAGSMLSEGGADGICSIFAKRKGRRKTLSFPVLIRIGWVGLFLALAHGMGNTSLNYSPYPLKVAFKSCKLVPTMAMGACVTGRKHTALQYTAALVMGIGLAVLTAADVFNSKQKMPLQGNAEWSKEIGPFVGPILLAISTAFDSIVPNLQEQLLQRAKVKTSEMILVSNVVMCIVIVGYTIYSHELIAAWNYCATHNDATGVLLMQGACAYLGLRSYLAIIRDHGGVVVVLLANARKIVTIILSFALYAKPFNERHFVGLVLVFVGVYLGYLSKKGRKEGAKGGTSGSPGRTRRKESTREGDESHEHQV